MQTERNLDPGKIADNILETFKRSTLFNPTRWRLWHNFPQKVGALVAAVLLWFAATADRRALTTRNFDVPLTVVGMDTDRVVTGQPKTIRVTVEGQSSRLESLSLGQFEATVDVGGLDDGFFSKQVTVNGPSGTLIKNTQPKQVSGNLDAVVRENVEVRVALLDSTAVPPLGIRVKPDNVVVIGPRPRVAQVVYALALAGRQVVPNKPVEVRLTPMDSSGKPVEGVRLEPARAKISQ